MSKKQSTRQAASRGLYRASPLIVVAVASGLATVALLALLVDIFEKKEEARSPFFRVVNITDENEDPALWRKNFPLQYDAYKRTVDMERTRYGGSEALPRTPTQADPRSIIAQSKLEEDPRLKLIWAGYPFATDFREDRGHAYMLEDQTYTRRQEFGMPGTCIQCHASTYVPYMKAGGGNLIKGSEAIDPRPYAEIRPLFTHPIGCIDCHDPSNMSLRVTRPAFLEGIKIVKAAEGIDDYEVNSMATRQEMRTYVCAQCHIEYYFKGTEKRLTHPWFKGLRGDDILAYYDEIDFKDWTHATTGAALIKAQHPEFEVWSQGIHARSGVSCADCHMPYTRVGALKISDHHIRSPLLNISNACQTCHRIPELELSDRVETIQGRFMEMRDIAMNALVELIHDIGAARHGGASKSQLAPALDFQRKATFLLDFVEAENSMGFHADQETARVLTKSLDYTRQGQVSLREVGRTELGMKNSPTP